MKHYSGMGQVPSTEETLAIKNYGEVRGKSIICKMPLGLDEGKPTDDGVFIRPNDNKYKSISVNPATILKYVKPGDNKYVSISVGSDTSKYDGKTMNVFALPPFLECWKTVIEDDTSILPGRSITIPVELFLMDMKTWKTTRECTIYDAPFGEAEYVYVKRGTVLPVTEETSTTSESKESPSGIGE